MVQNVARKSTAGVAVERDGRGMHNHNRKSEAVRDRIRKHIRSFPAVESHYARADSNRTYLDPQLNVRKMYSLYKDSCKLDDEIPQNYKLFQHSTCCIRPII